MNAKQRAEMEQLALAVRRARMNARKEEPLPVTEEERLCDCWDDEPLLLDEQDEVDGGSRPA